jgi:hypothetical protein
MHIGLSFGTQTYMRMYMWLTMIVHAVKIWAVGLPLHVQKIWIAMMLTDTESENMNVEVTVVEKEEGATSDIFYWLMLIMS